MKKIVLSGLVAASLLFGANVDNGISNTFVGTSDSNTVGGVYNTVTDSSFNEINGDSNSLVNSNYNTVESNANNYLNSQNITFKSTNPIGGNDFSDSDAIEGSGWGNNFSNSSFLYLKGNHNTVVSNNNNGDGDGYIIGNNSVITGDNVISIGSKVNINGNNAVSLGNDTTISGNNSVAFGGGASVTGNNSVALGSNSVATADNVISVGSVGNERKITNVATGTADTDAANTKQVNDAKNEAVTTAQAYADSVGVTTLNSANSYTDTKFASFTGGGVSETVVDNKIEASEKRSMDYTDSKISALESSLTQEYRSATATAIALGVSPILADGNKNAIGVGFGNYEGQSAVAINYIAEIDKNVYFQTGMSLNASARGIKAGVSFGF